MFIEINKKELFNKIDLVSDNLFEFEAITKEEVKRKSNKI